MKKKVKKKEKYKIYLFRHGKTTYNRDGRFTGQSESRLTDEGEKHARIIARKMKNKKFQVAIRTRLSRSKDTLKPVLEKHPECVLVIEDDRMIERGYGSLEGMTHEQFIDKIGKKEYDMLVHGDYMTEIEDTKTRNRVKDTMGKQVYEFIHRGYKIAADDGESFADVEKRVKEFIRDLKKFMRKNKVNVAISAHGNSIRLFRKIMEKKTIEETVKWFIPYDKIFKYTIQ